MCNRPTKAYFISDLHLGARYLSDPREAECRVVRFLDSIAADATHLFLLGDILDYWYEYRSVVPRGYVRFFAALARLADAGVQLTWMTGNHDVWLFDYLRDEIGLTVAHEPIVVNLAGRTLFMSHGDDVGKIPFRYRFMKACFTSRVCQTLYAAVHPRWTMAVATGWSTSNRTHRKPEVTQQMAAQNAAAVTEFATAHHQQHPEVWAYVFGHLHIADVREIDPDCHILWLGDWINKFTYAVLDEHGMSLRKWNESDAPTEISKF